jgi:hypothetical protein
MGHGPIFIAGLSFAQCVAWEILIFFSILNFGVVLFMHR